MGSGPVVVSDGGVPGELASQEGGASKRPKVDVGGTSGGEPPSLGAAGGRGVLAAALAVIGDPDRARQAQDAFRQAALAESTAPVFDSLLNTLEKLAKAGRFELLPMGYEKLNLIGRPVRRQVTGAS